LSRSVAVELHEASASHSLVERSEPIRDAQVARYEWNLQKDNWKWESTVFDIYGVKVKGVRSENRAFLSRKHPDDVMPRRAMMQRLEGGKVRSYVHRVFREDGFVRLVNSSAIVMFDARRRPDVMQGTVEILSNWEHPLSGHDLKRASDGVLMLCFRAQSPEALAEAFRRHGDSVARVVRHLRYSSANADDVVQDVFEALCRKQGGGFDARLGSLAVYLNMQARSRCIDLVRSQTARFNRELAYDQGPAFPHPEDNAVSTLFGHGIRRALASLDDDERVPIELAYFGGLTYHAVADYLNLPEGTVKSRIRRGLLRLRDSSDLVDGPT